MKLQVNKSSTFHLNDDITYEIQNHKFALLDTSINNEYSN